MKNLLLKRWLFLIAFFLPPAFMYGTGFPGLGAGTQANPYQIETLDHLRYLSEHSSYWSAGTYFVQTADIDATTTTTWNSNGAGGYYGFSPIGTGWGSTFQGNYDGQNHSIDGLYINRPATDFIGLFGSLKGVLQNLQILNVNITGKDHVGGALGLFYNATVTNCVVTGSVTGNNNVGGFVGVTYTDGNPYKISKCYTSGAVSGVSIVGGFIGNQYIMDIEDSFSLCNVTRISGTALNIGAFCGEIGGQGLAANPIHPIVKNCYATGTVYSSPTNVWGNGDGLSANVGFIGEYGSSYGGANNDNFFDSQTTLQTSGIGATAKTTAEMKTQATFTNWDFATIWNLSSGINNGYPAFQWMGPALPNNPGTFAATANSNSQVDCSWTLNSNSDPVLLAFNTTSSFGNPTGTYSASDLITGGGTVLYVGSGLSHNHTALTTNTHYYYKIWSKDGTDVYSNGATDDDWTLANVPSAPTVNNPTATTLDVAVNVNGNPASTEFAIYETSTDKFVQADGTLGASAVWATATTWGTKTLTGLTTGTEYTFEVKARNGGNTETAYGATADGTPATAPTVEFPVSAGWTETGPLPVYNKNWQFASMSSDGSKMLTGINGGRLYLSTDVSNTWSETGPTPFGGKDWFSAAVSSDGSKMAACVYGGRLYLSADGGTTWAETGPAPLADKDWATVSLSSNGSKMLAGIDNSRLYLSSDGGTSWTETQPAGENNRSWQASAISSDGNTMLAGAMFSRLYISSNGGSTWTQTGPIPLGNKAWHSVSITSDGSKILAGVYNGRLYLSTDTGATWSETGPTPLGDKVWTYSTMSSDGATMLAGVENGRLYMSTNGGTTWIETQPAGDGNQNWQAVALSSNGSKMLAGASQGRLYKSASEVLKVTEITSTTATGNGKITNLNGGGNATNRGVIYYPFTGTKKVIGDPNVTNISENGSYGTGDFTASLTGLAVNTHYNLRAHATNSVGTGYSDTTIFWTLANVPSAPTVNNPTATTLDVLVNVNSNPISTEFAIRVTAAGLDKFVQANGTLGATAVWATASTWGTKTVTGLTTGTEYTFEVKARNGINVETAYGSGTSANTCANPTDGGDIGNDQSICTGATPEALTSISAASNYGGTLEYKWQSSITSANADFNDIANSNAATYSPGTLTQSTWYKRLARVECKADWTGAAESNAVAVTVNSYETPSVSIAQTTGINPCCPPDLVTLTATPVNGGLNPTYEWFKNDVSVASTASYTFNPLDSDAVYVVMTTSVQCYTDLSTTSNTITMQEISPATVMVSMRAAKGTGREVVFTAYPINGGDNPVYKWYKNNVLVQQGSSPVLTSECTAGDEHYVELYSSLPCGVKATSLVYCSY